MRCEIPIDKGLDTTKQRELLERGARLRSELLDAFALLEEVIIEKLARNCTACSWPSLKQKLDALANAPFRYPARAKQRIAEVRPLIECRNDIVHSALSVANLCGAETNSYFVFRNVAVIPDCTGRQMRALTLEELKSLIACVKTATKHLGDQPMKAAAPTALASAT